MARTPGTYGLPMHQGDDYVVSFNTPAEVRDVAAALTDLDLEPFIARYRTLDPPEFDSALCGPE